MQYETKHIIIHTDKHK